MKKIVYILTVLLVISALSGCGSPLEKPAPNPKPAPSNTAQNSNSGTSSNQGNAGQNNSAPSGSGKVSESTSSNQSNQNSSTQASEATLGAETMTVNGKVMVKNTDSVLVLVNKTRNLPSDYKPSDLVIPKVAFTFTDDRPQRYMRKVAASALEELFKEASSDGIRLYAVSGFRPYSNQQSIYNNEVKRSGEKAANQVVALPGQSEHQTGLAMDVSSASVNYGLVDSFENTKEGTWLKEHAKDAGFIIRYQKDKVAVTGYSFEPWHIRYVGKEAADYIVSHGITFDEYASMLSNN